jgi:2-oxoisovalerate dehydrogenase E1 component
MFSKTNMKKGFSLMAKAKAMAELYEENFSVVSKYVHATSRGHEAIQVALGMQLLPQDYVAPYYRDDAMLLALGMKPYDLMLQLLAKKDDPFSGGRSYYAHPSLKDDDKPKIPHQSSATGMQAIPTTGVALGIRYKEHYDIDGATKEKKKPVVVCSLGDASVTEGEISEAFQMAALKQLPICFLVQDNEWDISAYKDEVRTMDAYQYIKGFPGIEAYTINGSNFKECYDTVEKVFKTMRKERRPFLIHAKVPLLNHHTSGVRMEWYRDDLDEQKKRDPYPKFKSFLKRNGFSTKDIKKIETDAINEVARDYDLALQQDDPTPEDLYTHDYAPTPIVKEEGARRPKNGEEKVMVDCALFAYKELLEQDERCLIYGQDVGKRCRCSLRWSI